MIDPVVDPAEPPDEHQREEREQREDRPEREVGASRIPVVVMIEIGLEDRRSDRLLALGDAVAPELDEQRDRRDEDDADVEPELLVAHEHARPASDEPAVEEQRSSCPRAT